MTFKEEVDYDDVSKECIYKMIETLLPKALYKPEEAGKDFKIKMLEL